MSEAGLGALCGLGSGMLWAVTSLLVRTLSPHLSSLKINALRSVLSGLLLVGWIVLTGQVAQVAAMSSRSLVLMTLSVVAAIGVGDTVFFESTKTLGLARAMTVSMIYPLLAAVLAAAFLGEALTVRLLAGSLLTLGGLVLIVITRDEARAPGAARWSGLGAAGLAAVAWAVSTVMMRAPLREVDPVTAQAVRLALGGALLWVTPWARGATREIHESGPAAVSRLLGIGALTAVSSVMFMASLKYTGVAVAAVLSSTAPMFAIPLGIFFLGERLTPAAILGCVVTVIGLAVLQI